MIIQRRTQRSDENDDHQYHQSYRKRDVNHRFNLVFKSNLFVSNSDLPVKRCSTMKSRLSTPLECTRKASAPSSIQKYPPTRVATLHKRIEQLERELARSRENNRHLNQRLTTTLSRIEFLKITNQKLITECDKFKANRLNQTQDSTMAENSLNLENLHERLKNASSDAAQQRKINKSLQTNNDILNKNLQSLTDK